MDFCEVKLAPADTKYNGLSFFQDDRYDLFSLPEDALEPHYYIQKCLGRGGFGAVFLATDQYHRQCAIKIQRKQCHNPSPLTHELDIYQRVYIDRTTGFPSTGIPRVYDYRELETHEFLVMEQCGDSLETIMQRLPGGRISKKSALMIGIQAVRVLETLHRHGILHRDIKPANIVMGLGPSDQRTVHLLDFGLAQTVEDWENYNFEGEVPFAGTEYFASVEALFRKTPTPSGDLQSLAYTILFIVVGKLPWVYQDEITDRPLTLGELGIQRIRCKAEKLCSNFPELKTFMKVVCRIRRMEVPDYDNLVSLLEEALQSMNCENNGGFEWLEPMRRETANMTTVDTSNPSEHDIWFYRDHFFETFPDSKTTSPSILNPDFQFQKSPNKNSCTTFDTRLMMRYRDQNSLMQHMSKPTPTKEYGKTFPNSSHGFFITNRKYENHKRLDISLRPEFSLSVSDVAVNAVIVNDTTVEGPARDVGSLVGPCDYRFQSWARYFSKLLREDEDPAEIHEVPFNGDNNTEHIVSQRPSAYRPFVQELDTKRKVPRSRKSRGLLKSAVGKGMRWLVQKIVGDSISNLAHCGGLVF